MNLNNYLIIKHEFISIKEKLKVTLVFEAKYIIPLKINSIQSLYKLLFMPLIKS